MAPRDFVLALISSLSPSPVTGKKQIIGKKRLQKLAMLLQVAGCSVDLRFSLHHYGPFSSELARAVDELSVYGLIEERVDPLGVFGTFQSTFTLADAEDTGTELPVREKTVLQKLDAFSTIELEVASTVAYFEQKGDARNLAVEKTIAMKPSKAIPSVLAKVDEILKIVH